MVDPILLAKGTDAALSIINENQKGFLNYVLVMRFGKRYKKYLRQNILLHKYAELEAEDQIMRKISNEDVGTLSLIKEESEIEYRNMAGVLIKTLPKIVVSSEGRSIDSDKIKRLKDLSKQFSSADMQEIISSIIAGEYNQSGAFSLHTISIVNNLTKEDITIFERICGLTVSTQFLFSDMFTLTKDMIDFRSKHMLKRDDLLHIQSIGLLAVQPSSLQIGDDGVTSNQRWSIGGEMHDIIINGSMQLSPLLYLTKSGQELAQLIKPTYRDQINKWIIDHLTSKGFIVK